MLNDIDFLGSEPVKIPEGKVHLVYIGVTDTDKTKHKYVVLSSEYINDGKMLNDRVQATFKVKWTGSPGTIYQVSSDDCGKTISVPKKNIPVGFWKNNSQRNEWVALHRANEDAFSMENKSKDDINEKLLLPFREAYLKAGNRQKRSVLLARIIDYISYGRI